MTDNTVIFEALEVLAQRCPWDRVEMWASRVPEGKYSFTAHIDDNDELGFSSVFGHGPDPMSAALDALRCAGDRDPEVVRKRCIRELEEKISKLKAAVFTLPPYVPNRELCAGNPELENYHRRNHATIEL